MNPEDAPPVLRRRLAEEWARAAAFEHASIASFARFTLQLLALGAPAALVEAAQRAGLDEVDHARRSFRLASAYGGVSVGPGPLPLPGDLLGSLDLADIAVATVHEGCVGETLAAAEANEALRRVEVDLAREALQAVAADEARHAELAWAFVGWAQAVGGSSVRHAVRRAFAEAVTRRPNAPPPDPDEALLRAHGRLTARCRAILRAQVLSEVIATGARALEVAENPA